MAEATWWLEVECPDVARGSRPGRFVMIGFGLENTDAPFLPRPFSVGWRSPDGRLGFLVREFGAGTRRLASVREGDRLLLLGPLGSAFRPDPERPSLCVAGGVGLAPFIFLAAEERARGRELRLLYGERVGSRVFDPALLETLARGSVEVWTEDGRAGLRGPVTRGIDLRGDPLLMACGPTPMLRAVAELAREADLPLQVSVEEHMACGIGTCQGCVVAGADGRWIQSCTEGPVFRASELSWP
ncbi:MAG: dihydroorotate dehydrogenase electron transfer subunit [Gemmatimonadota bacterium]